MALDLKRLMAVIAAKEAGENEGGEDPINEKIKNLNDTLSKQGLYYDPERMKVFQIKQTGNRPYVYPKGMKEYDSINAITNELMGSAGRMKKEFTDEQLEKMGFRRDKKSGDVFKK